VDAEEKKLLHNPESGSHLNRQTDFRLHCFPDIPFEDPDSERVCAPLVDKFHRIQYDDETNCTDGLPDFDNPETRSGKISSAVDQFEVQAYQKGFSDGLEKGTQEGETAGFEQASKKLEPLLEGLQQALMQLGNLRQNTYRIIEQEVVELALAIARKIICREIEVDKEVVVCVAREALSQVEDPGYVKIKMNPTDFQFMNDTKYQLSELIGNIDNVTIEPGKNIRSGGCVIETNLGEIDARIEQQLQAVEESFRTALENTSTSFQPG
jgi:flagellar biosynthesis/type III secretory pathway protein FliH